MAKLRKTHIVRDNIRWFILVPVFVLIAGLWLFCVRDSGEDAAPAPEVPGGVYVCNGCGKEYVGQFPYVSPWAGYPTELIPIEVTNIGRETSYNGSTRGATPVKLYQSVTGKLSSREDVDFYSFAVDGQDGVNFCFSFDGSAGGYTYLWDAAVYAPDGTTALVSGPIQIEEGEDATFGVSGLETGTHYLKISAASGGNPLMNGYSDTDYHICFLPKCAEHTAMTHTLTMAPTCTQAGELTDMCRTCGIIVSTEVLEPLGHIWSKWEPVEENFFSPICGDCRRVCALCGEEETDTLFLHFLDGGPKPDPNAVTVTETGSPPERSVKTECSVCGNVEVESKKGAGPACDKWEPSRTPTRPAEGKRVLPAIIVSGIMAVGALLVLASRMTRKARRSAGKQQREKTFLCPYCFETSPIDSVEFRCTNKLCRDVPDPQMTKYLHSGHGLTGKPTFGNRAIQWDVKGRPHSARCPKCHETSYKVICPVCHNPLPESTLAGDDMIISVIGSRDTGKTHFLAVIINELIERIAPSFGGTFEGFDDTMDRYAADFKKKLYVELRRFDKTDSSLVNVDNGAYRPLIYMLKLQAKGLLGLKKRVRIFTLVFFDSAGEDLKSEEVMRTVNRYISKSSGIIFLLDPLKIPTVRAQLDERAVNRASSADVESYKPDDILVRVSSLIRKEQGLSDSDKIKVPVSVVFSKLDVIEPLIPRGCTLLDPSPHCKEGVFDLSDWHNVNAEVQGLLRTWESGSLLSQLELNYTNYSCFGVSSLGMHNSPDDHDKISRPRPHRIEDPLLWILMKQKVIKARK